MAEAALSFAPEFDRPQLMAILNHARFLAESRLMHVLKGWPERDESPTGDTDRNGFSSCAVSSIDRDARGAQFGQANARA